jgi:hypothetical protein
MGIRGDQPDAGQAARNEGPQEGRPGRLRLGRSDGAPEDLPLTALVGRDRDEERGVHDPAPLRTFSYWASSHRYG